MSIPAKALLLAQLNNMKRTLLLLLITVALPCSTARAIPRIPKKKMKAFTSERELRNYFRKLAEKQDWGRRSMRERLGVASVVSIADREEPIRVIELRRINYAPAAVTIGSSP